MKAYILPAVFLLPLFLFSTGLAETTYRFAPEPGRYLRHFQAEIVITINDQVRQSQQTESVRQWDIQKKDDGWSIHSSNRQFSTSGERNSVESMLERIVMESEYTLFLNAEGRLQLIEGFEDLKERLLQALPKELESSAGVLFIKENQLWRVGNDWENEYGFWEPGLPLEVGSRWEVERELVPPSGPSMHSMRHYILQGFEREEDRLLAVIAFKGEARILKGEETAPSLTFTDEGVYTYDLGTGLLRKGEGTRELQLTQPLPSGETFRQTHLEKRRFYFEKE